jgi:hypothetical protein
MLSLCSLERLKKNSNLGKDKCIFGVTDGAVDDI